MRVVSSVPAAVPFQRPPRRGSTLSKRSRRAKVDASVPRREVFVCVMTDALVEAVVSGLF